MKSSNILDKIPNVRLDPNGVFKYIQIFIKNSTGESKHVVRGYAKFKYHADNYDDFIKELSAVENSETLQSECVGGGRVNVNKENKTIFVYGYSQAFGRCDHQLSCDILKTQFTDYEINWSNEGY